MEELWRSHGTHVHGMDRGRDGNGVQGRLRDGSEYLCWFFVVVVVVFVVVVVVARNTGVAGRRLYLFFLLLFLMCGGSQRHGGLFSIPYHTTRAQGGSGEGMGVGGGI